MPRKPARPMMPVTLGQILPGLPEGGRSSRTRQSRDRPAPAGPVRVIETPEVTHIRYAVGDRTKLELDDRGSGGS